MTTTKASPAEYMHELADKTGVAVTSVTNGHVLIFTKKHLEGLLEVINAQGKDRCIVFVKNPTFQN